MHSNAICVITLRPKEYWCEFLSTFRNYDTFVVVDDDEFDLKEFKTKYKKVKFLQPTECGHFRNSNVLFVSGVVSGWDKAIFWFCKNIGYKKIWLIEDDVFIYDENTLTLLDKKYSEDDLLSKKHEVNKTGSLDYWHWRRADMRVESPWYRTMVCAVRVSDILLGHVERYVEKHNTLFFIEALFPTIAMKNQLKCSMPEEFDEIHFRKSFEAEDIKKNKLYHPVKDINNHKLFRNLRQA